MPSLEGAEHELDPQHVPGPLLALVEVAVVREEWIVDLFGGPIGHGLGLILFRLALHRRLAPDLGEEARRGLEPLADDTSALLANRPARSEVIAETNKTGAQLAPAQSFCNSSGSFAKFVALRWPRRA